jgi:hypothetical protein
MKNWKFTIFAALLFGVSTLSAAESTKIPSRVTMSREVLLDKIKGGWAGQVLGCTYGGPTEFKWRSEMIPADHHIPWSGVEQVTGMMKSWPTLYDDIYMDLTFVGVFDRLGLDAPQDSLAAAFAYEGYHLWHANQAARYNILNGISAPRRVIGAITPTPMILTTRLRPILRALCRPVCPIRLRRFRTAWVIL